MKNENTYKLQSKTTIPNPTDSNKRSGSYKLFCSSIFKIVSEKHNVNFSGNYLETLKELESKSKVEKQIIEILADLYREYEEITYGGKICDLEKFESLKKKSQNLILNDYSQIEAQSKKYSMNSGSSYQKQSYSKVTTILNRFFWGSLKFFIIILIAHFKPHLTESHYIFFVRYTIVNVGWFVWLIFFAAVVFVLIRKKVIYITLFAIIKPNTYTGHYFAGIQMVNAIWLVWLIFFSLYVIVNAFKSPEKSI